MVYFSSGDARSVGCCSPMSHLQLTGNPLPCHRCFRAQARCHLRFLFMAFSVTCKILHGPSGLFQHLSYQSLRLLFVRFPALRFLPYLFRSLSDHFQQFLPKTLRPPAPTPSQLFPILILLVLLQILSLFHARLQLSPSCSIVFSDHPFSHQSVHTQPTRPFAPPLQIRRPTAPAILRQTLFRPQ
jgi:hypothetical protein